MMLSIAHGQNVIKYRIGLFMLKVDSDEPTQSNLMIVVERMLCLPLLDVQHSGVLAAAV